MKVRLGAIKNTQPRRAHGDIEGLKASIREVGLIHPPTVDENLNLLAGRRRYQALMELYGPDYEVEVTVLPVNGDRLKAFLAAVHENIHRLNMSDPEAASAFKEYNELRVQLSGQRQPGGEGGSHIEGVVPSWNNAEGQAGWSLRESAKDWGISPTTGHRAIKIATAIEEHPDLAGLRSGQAILAAYQRQEAEKALEQMPCPRRKGYPSFIPLEAIWPTPRTALKGHCEAVRRSLRELTKQLKALEAPSLHAEELESLEVQEAWAELRGVLAQFKEVVAEAIEETEGPIEDALLDIEIASSDLPVHVGIPIGEKIKEHLRRVNEMQVRAYLEAGGIPFWRPCVWLWEGYWEAKREGKPPPRLPEPDDGGRPGWTRWGLESV